MRFAAKQENLTRITTFVHNLYPNYQASLNYYFFVIEISKHNKLYQQTMPFIDCIMSTKLYKRSKVIYSATILVISMRKFVAQKHFDKIFFWHEFSRPMKVRGFHISHSPTKMM